MQKWTIIFRVLANINRLKIIKMLFKRSRMNVGEISEELKISFKATSNHLMILKNLDVIVPNGTGGHVFYSLNKNISQDFQKAINLFIK